MQEINYNEAIHVQSTLETLSNYVGSTLNCHEDYYKIRCLLAMHLYNANFLNHLVVVYELSSNNFYIKAII